MWGFGYEIYKLGKTENINNYIETNKDSNKLNNEKKEDQKIIKKLNSYDKRKFDCPFETKLKKTKEISFPFTIIKNSYINISLLF